MKKARLIGTLTLVPVICLMMTGCQKTDSKAEYEAFLKGDRTDSVSFEAYTEDLCQYVAEDWSMDGAEPKSISYSFIDCGNDGEEELAVLYTQIGDEAMDINYITIFKLMDNEIKNIFCESFGYRSYALLNQYGFYTYGGSNGASSSTVVFSYVDGAGKKNYLYGMNDELSAYSLYVPGTTDYMDVAAEEGIAENIEIQQYFFNEYDETQDYAEYVSNCDYVYIPTDDTYQPLEGAELEEALSTGAYERFWESTGLPPALSQEQMDDKIAKKLDSIGVTDEILDAPDVTWTPFEK